MTGYAVAQWSLGMETGAEGRSPGGKDGWRALRPPADLLLPFFRVDWARQASRWTLSCCQAHTRIPMILMAGPRVAGCVFPADSGSQASASCSRA